LEKGRIMKFTLSAGNRKRQEMHRHYNHNSGAKCSFCRTTVMAPGESEAEGEVAGIDETTGMLICRHCVENYMSETLMTA
jgi:hypothetical protein